MNRGWGRKVPGRLERPVRLSQLGHGRAGTAGGWPQGGKRGPGASRLWAGQGGQAEPAPLLGGARC